MRAKSPPRPTLRLSDLKVLARQLRERAQQERERAAQAAEAARQAERERHLFAQTVGQVTPLPDRQRRVAHAVPLEPTPRQREADEARVLQDAMSDEFDPASLLDTDDQLAYAREGVGADVVRRLRMGQWAVQAHLDLHGHTKAEARLALAGFLHQVAVRGWRCVRVVHGKGLGSPGREPVLKHKVRSWLVQRDDVLAFVQARGPDGGAGALIVLLDRA